MLVGLFFLMIPIYQLYIKLFAVQLDKPEISNVRPTCNSVSFSWNHDTKKYVEVESYTVTVTRSSDQKRERIKSVSSNTSQVTFIDLDENTEYKLAVKQTTDLANIGHESVKEATTTQCMFILHSYYNQGCREVAQYSGKTFPGAL